MRCGFCAQTRQLLVRALRPLPGRRCLVQGCTAQPDRMICPAHWRALPLTLRQRWWRETDYNSVAPSRQLLDEVNAAVRDKKVS